MNENLVVILILVFTIVIFFIIPFSLSKYFNRKNEIFIQKAMDRFLFEFDNKKFIELDGELYILVNRGGMDVFGTASLRKLDKMEIRKYIVEINFKRSINFDKNLYTKKEWVEFQGIFTDKLNKILPFCDAEWLEQNKKLLTEDGIITELFRK